MTTAITQVQNKTQIRDAEFIKITVPGAPDSPYRFSNSYRTETIAGEQFGGSYTSLGGLVTVSGQQRDLSVTSYDTSISLAGVDKTKIGLIIDAGLKGSSINIWRGFYTANYELDGNFVLRYTGVITGYDINEERVDTVDAFTLTLHCSSFKQVLENRVSGRYTNQSSWQNFDSADVSMNSVAALKDAKFNFGQMLA
jgi:hypothetical protein